MLLQTRSVKAELKPLSLCFQCFSDPVHAVGSHVACPGKDNPVAELHLKGIFFMAHKKPSDLTAQVTTQKQMIGIWVLIAM